MKLIINKDRSVIQIGTWGTKNENDFEVVDFEFPEELEGYNKRIVYLLGGGDNPWGIIDRDNKAYITSEITSKENVKGYVWCTKGNPDRPADTDFRSREFDIPFYENENATGVVPTPQQVDGFNEMLTAMNAKIDEVDALEQTIGAAEAQRQEAETTRVSNENTRESNESTRQTNEQTRQTQEADRERRTDEAIGNIEDKTAEYNANAEAKTTAFNNNATQKTNDFNTNATTQKTDFNSNASSKTSAFNSNAETKTNTFNTNATNKTNDFNSNATEKTTAFDNNATEKTSEFNTNAESKTSAFNDNATQKTTNFDNNASEKTDEFNTNAQEKIDEYDEHIVEYQAQIDELQEEVEELSENMPWNETEQATEITVDDAAKYSKNKMKVFGNTEQTQYSGKNLLDDSLLPITAYGLTISKDANGNIVINGTPNYQEGYKSFTIGRQKTIDAGTYTSSIANKKVGLGINVGGFGGYLNITMADTVTSKTNTSNATYTIQGIINIRYDAGTFDNYIFNPMLELSSTATDYEPYTGGAPSPNPDYPQPIHVVTGENTIEVQGKNLFDKDKVTIYGGYFSATGVIKGKGSSGSSPDKWFYVPCKPNTTYIIIKPVTPVLSNNRFRIGTTASIPNDNSILNDFWMEPNGSTVTQHIITTSNNAKYLCVYYGTNPDAWGDKILEVLDGLIISYFSSYPINLGSIELCKIRDYQDYLYKENGNWYVFKRITKMVLNGTESWERVSSSTNPRFTFRISGGSVYGYSNYFTYIQSQAAMTNHSIGLGSSTLSIRYDELADVQELKTWLASHNTVLYYILLTPTSTIITDETLIAQLDAIYEHLKLVKDTNNIIVTASDLAPYMKLTYMQDLKSKLDNLDSRLSLLE